MSDLPPDNNVGAAPWSQYSGDQLACFDRLPTRLRRTLQEGVLDWDAREADWHLETLLRHGVGADAAAEQLAAQLQRADEREIATFALQWPAELGNYPAVAAAASIMRYDEASRLRRARRTAPRGTLTVDRRSRTE